MTRISTRCAADGSILNIELEDVSYAPAALLAIPRESRNFDAAVVKDSLIEWVEYTAINRREHPTLVAHASAEWTAKHFDAPRDDVKSPWFQHWPN